MFENKSRLKRFSDGFLSVTMSAIISKQVDAPFLEFPNS